VDRDDALDDEMRRYPRNPVPPLDPTMVERILDGTVHAQDVAPDYRDVLRVLAAAAAPAAPTPAAEAAALAAFRSTRHPVDPPRRKSVLGKLLGAKALAALVLGTASVGTAAAAAAGALPDPAQATAHRIVAAVPDSDRAAQAGSGVGSEAGSRGSTAGEHAAGSAAGSHASTAGDHAALPGAAGLCQAYASGQGGENGRRLDATGFQRLADAAGGTDRIAAYCAKVTAGTRTADSAATAAGQHGALVGSCRSWLAADRAGRTATMATPVLDRLAAAAGGPGSIATYCSDLVGSAPGQPAATETARAKPAPPTKPAGGHSTPSHPAPPTPTPQG
jgi:hypothetical protein